MEHITEFAKSALNLFRSVVKPVYITDDLTHFDPRKKTIILKKNSKKQSSNEQSANKQSARELGIFSWNIWRGYNKEQILTSLKTIFQEKNPSVLFFQEIPVYEKSSLVNHFLEDFLFKKYSLFYAPNHLVKKNSHFYPFSHSGPAIASEYPFLETKVYPLPTVANQHLGKNHVVKRIVLYACISLAKKKIGLYNVHLECIAGERGRRKQIDYILDLIKSKKDDVVIIGGDFNFLFGNFFEGGISLLEKNGFSNLFSDWELRKYPRLDYFFVKGASAKGMQLKGKGSDHQPVGCVVDLK